MHDVNWSKADVLLGKYGPPEYPGVDCESCCDTVDSEDAVWYESIRGWYCNEAGCQAAAAEFMNELLYKLSLHVWNLAKDTSSYSRQNIGHELMPLLGYKVCRQCGGSLFIDVDTRCDACQRGWTR